MKRGKSGLLQLSGSSLVFTGDRRTVGVRISLLSACGVMVYMCLFVGLLVACLTSQQQTGVSQGRICLDNFTC